jgi:hypothetical protein
MLTLDHARLVARQPRELKRLRRFLLEATAGSLTELAVEHKADDSCCRREPWNATLAAVVLSVKPPCPVVAVNLPREGG